MKLAKSGTLSDLQEQASRHLAKVQQERDLELKREREIEVPLAATRAELTASRAHAAGLVPRAAYEALQEELQRHLVLLEAEQAEARRLRACIAEAEARRQRMTRQRQAREEEEEERRRLQDAALENRRCEARRISTRAVATQREKCSVQQQQQLGELRRRRESLELDLRAAGRRSAELERSMEVARAQNRRLEAQEQRVQAQAKEQEHALREELRRSAQQVRFLTALVRDVSPEREEEHHEGYDGEEEDDGEGDENSFEQVLGVRSGSSHSPSYVDYGEHDGTDVGDSTFDFRLSARQASAPATASP